MKGNTLYIIGNGFDIHHNLKTLTKHFTEILSKQPVYNKLTDAAEIFLDCNVDWSEYENSLSQMDLDILEEDNINSPDYLSDHEYDRDGVIWNMEYYTDSLLKAVKNSLAEMIENADKNLDTKHPLLRNFIATGDAILSFNYTSTIETLYTPPKTTKILHIHGYFKSGEELIFGYKNGDNHILYEEKHFSTVKLQELENKIIETEHNSNLSESDKKAMLDYYYEIKEHYTDSRDYYVDKQREEIMHLYTSFKKELQIDKLSFFLNSLSDITTIVVMGHSMANVDSEYMEMVEQLLHPRTWYISQYEGNPSLASLSSYSFSNKIQFYDLSDYNK